MQFNPELNSGNREDSTINVVGRNGAEAEME